MYSQVHKYKLTKKTSVNNLVLMTSRKYERIMNELDKVFMWWRCKTCNENAT